MLARSREFTGAFLFCLSECDYYGKIFPYGAEFVSRNGCDRCTCGEDGVHCSTTGCGKHFVCLWEWCGSNALTMSIQNVPLNTNQTLKPHVTTDLWSYVYNSGICLCILLSCKTFKRWQSSSYNCFSSNTESIVEIQRRKWWYMYSSNKKNICILNIEVVT